MATSDPRRDELILRLVATLHPLCELSDAGRLQLARHALLERLEQGRSISAEGSAPWLTYLAQGRVGLEGRQASETVEAGSPRSKLPLFGADPSATATTLAKSFLLRVDRRLVDLVFEEEERSRASRNHPGTLEGDIGFTGLPLFNLIYQAYVEERLELPTLPDVAFRIREAISSSDVGVKQVAKIVLSDPTLSARLIQVANSPAYRGATPVKTVLEAVSRLGLAAAQNIAFGLSLKGAFKGRSPRTEARLKEVYSHSTLVASFCYILAKGSGLNPERALLGGLIHDLGVVPIVTHADRHRTLAFDDAELEFTIGRLRGIVGNMVLTRLGFEPELIRVAEEAESWQRETGGDADYCDLAILAHLHASFGSPSASTLPRVDEVPAFRKLQLELDPSLGLKVLHEGKALATSISQALN